MSTSYAIYPVIYIVRGCQLHTTYPVIYIFSLISLCMIIFTLSLSQLSACYLYPMPPSRPSLPSPFFSRIFPPPPPMFLFLIMLLLFKFIFDCGIRVEISLLKCWQKLAELQVLAHSDSN